MTVYIIDKNGYIAGKICNVANVKGQKLWNDPFNIDMMHHCIGDDGQYVGSVFAGYNWKAGKW